MDKRLVCRVKVTRTDRSEPGISTGYAVCRNRIIMTRHAVFTDKRKLAEPIVVEWPLLRDPDTGKVFYRQFREEDILFKGEGVDDVLVVRCETPTEVPELPWMLLETPHTVRDEWYSYGFARTRRLAGKEDGLDVQGRMHQPNPHHAETALNVTTEVKPVENWKGISGAPIFIGKFMIGIIVEKELGQEFQLYGVSTAHLLRTNPDFREKLGLAQKSHCFDAAKSILGGKGSDVFNRLREQIGGSFTSIDDCLQHCAAIPVADLLGHIHQAQARASKQGKLEACLDLGRFLLGMLPNMVDQTSAENLKKSAKVSDGFMVEVPCATKVTAEALAARANERPVDFKVFGKDKVLPRYAIPIPAEMGSDDAKSFLDATTDHFYHSMGGRQEGRVLQAVTRFLYDEEIPDYLVGEADEELKLGMVQDNLEARERYGEPHYYWLMQWSEQPEELTLMLRLAQRIKQTYPQLLFIVLSKDNQLKRKEAREYHKLLDTLSYLYASHHQGSS